MPDDFCTQRKVTDVTETKLDLSRRNFLSGIATIAATVGLTSIAESAEAKTKKYKVCSTKDIKVGGATRFIIQGAGGVMVLITQPKAGVFRAFSAICTHAGIPLGRVNGKNIVCADGHQASFSLDSGKVTRGPANMPLPKYTLTKTGTTLYITI